MTKGTKIFRSIIYFLLAITMVWSGFWGITLISRIREPIISDEYDIWVVGVRVTTANAENVLGDGKVYYDSYNNTLTFDNAEIVTEENVIYSQWI